MIQVHQTFLVRALLRLLVALTVFLITADTLGRTILVPRLALRLQQRIELLAETGVVVLEIALPDFREEILTDDSRVEPNSINYSLLRIVYVLHVLRDEVFVDLLGEQPLLLNRDEVESVDDGDCIF